MDKFAAVKGWSTSIAILSSDLPAATILHAPSRSAVVVHSAVIVLASSSSDALLRPSAHPSQSTLIATSANHSFWIGLGPIREGKSACLRGLIERREFDSVIKKCIAFV